MSSNKFLGFLIFLLVFIGLSLSAAVSDNGKQPDNSKQPDKDKDHDHDDDHDHDGHDKGCYVNPNKDGSCPYDDIKFYLYTSKYPKGYQITKDNYRKVSFNKGPYIVVLHDYNSSLSDPDGVTNIIEAYNKKNPNNYNVIAINAELPFDGGNDLFFDFISNLDPTNILDTAPCYAQVAYVNSLLVGDCTAQFLQFLIKAKIVPYPKYLQFVGHGAGAHSLAYAAVQLRTSFSQAVGQLTGLDPLGPLYSSLLRQSDEVLDSTDADFVDVYHTNSGFYGTLELIGDVDVKFNGGFLQPPYKFENQDHNKNPNINSHYIVINYYAESTAPLPPYYRKFYGYKSIILIIFGPKYLVGYGIDTSLSGTFYVYTNFQPPFAQG